MASHCWMQHQCMFAHAVIDTSSSLADVYPTAAQRDSVHHSYCTINVLIPVSQNTCYPCSLCQPLWGKVATTYYFIFKILQGTHFRWTFSKHLFFSNAQWMFVHHPTFRKYFSPWYAATLRRSGTGRIAMITIAGAFSLQCTTAQWKAPLTKLTESPRTDHEQWEILQNFRVQSTFDTKIKSLWIVRYLSDHCKFCKFVWAYWSNPAV